MSDAITREEKLMESIAIGSPSNIKPITREEMFLAKAGGQDVETPEPITRREKLLQGIIDNGGGGGGGINPTGTINITSNGEHDVTTYAKANVSVPDDFFENYMARSFVTFESDTAYPIPMYMFANCLDLESVSMPNVEVVNGKAFMDCGKLNSVNLQKVKILSGNDCFRRTAITSFPYFEQLEEITGYCFDGCPIEQKVWDFKNLTTISAQFAFYNASAEVIILRNIVTTQDRTFANMPNLKVVDVHDSFTIGRYFFENSSKMEALILRDVENVAALRNVDALTSNTNYYAYVPASMLTRYQNATSWSAHTDRIRTIEDYPEITGGVYE